MEALGQLVLAGAFAGWYWTFNKQKNLPANGRNFEIMVVPLFLSVLVFIFFFILLQTFLFLTFFLSVPVPACTDFCPFVTHTPSVPVLQASPAPCIDP